MLNVFLAAALALHPTPQATDVSSSIASPPTPEQVLAIPDRLREEFRTKVLRRTHSPMERLQGLVDFLIDEDGFALQYKADATLTISESYQTRQANCLTFTMLAVALAREAGMDAYAQQLRRVFAWAVVDGVVIQAMHANLVVPIGSDKYILDIATDTPTLTRIDQRISDEHLLALYYGNRAMELLTEGQPAAARVWLDTALRHEPGDASLWSNSGLLYQRAGKPRLAEEMYRRAIRMDPELTSALTNLIALYREQGNDRKADALQLRAQRALREDPYYQYALGQQQEQSGDFAQAVDLYRRAISLHQEEHRFHYALARAYYRLGKLERADDQLQIARALSRGNNQLRYQAKLDALRRIASNR